MKHRINLYSSEYVPTVSYISLNSITFLFVFLIIVFTLFNIVLAWQNGHLQAQLDIQRKQLNSLQRSVDESQRILAARKPDQALLIEIEQQKLALSQRESLLKELSTREETKDSRFSQVLADLSSADLPTIWLTSIELNTGAVSLEGYGSKPDAMPIWLSHLSATSSFSGVDFDHVTIEKREQGLFFSLRTGLSINQQKGEE